MPKKKEIDVDKYLRLKARHRALGAQIRLYGDDANEAREARDRAKQRVDHVERGYYTVPSNVEHGNDPEGRYKREAMDRAKADLDAAEQTLRQLTEAKESIESEWQHLGSVLNRLETWADDINIHLPDTGFVAQPGARRVGPRDPAIHQPDTGPMRDAISRHR